VRLELTVADSKIHFLNYGTIVGRRQSVPTPTPIWLAIRFQPSPCARSVETLATSTTVRGRPSFLPFATAFRNPARTRSAMSLHSSSATAPSTVNTILPAGVDVSSDSESETKAMLPHRHFIRCAGVLFPPKIYRSNPASRLRRRAGRIPIGGANRLCPGPLLVLRRKTCTLR
jgi:hypothetical protein